MTVAYTAQELIPALSTNWAEMARENTRRANANDAAAKQAIEELQDKVPVQRVKQGSNTYTPDTDGTVTLPSGVVLPAMTTAQRNALANPVVGQGIYNTSTAREETYTATGWQGPIQALTTSQRTALTPAEGELVVDTTEGRLFQFVGGAWSPVGGCVIDVFTASSTWTKRTGAKLVMPIVFGSGASGAACAPTASTALWGGGTGARAQGIFAAALLPATVPVTVAAGGPAVSTTGTNVAWGQAGSASSFGSYVIAGGGGNPSSTAVSAGAQRGFPGTNIPRTSSTSFGVQPTDSTSDLVGQVATAYGASAAGGLGSTNSGSLGTSRGSGEANLGLGPGGGAGAAGVGGGALGAGIGGSAFGALGATRDGTTTPDRISSASILGGGTLTSRSGTGVGGDGGNGAAVNGNATATDGCVPGGGGGAALAANGFTATSGAGARGEVLVITWF